MSGVERVCAPERAANVLPNIGDAEPVHADSLVARRDILLIPRLVLGVNK